MELCNHTPYPAGLFRTVIDDRRIAASLLARVTYDIDDGRLTPSAAQTWTVSSRPWDCEYGPMDSDEVFYKGGVDLFVFGQARAPAGRDATQMELNVAVGGFRRRMAVFGDRIWERTENGLIPSSPKPFRAIPLTMANAFGGKDKWDGLDVPFADNPDGKGFYLEEEHAAGNPLPNIEDPDSLVTSWEDRPEPVGVAACPMHAALRLRNGVEFDAQGQLKSIRPAFFNAAFPRMILDHIAPGDKVLLTGFAESGPLILEIPRTELAVRLQFDQEVIERPLAIDQVGIEVDKQRAFLAYRYPFRYVLYPLQKRSCALFSSSASPTGVGAPTP